MGATALVAHSAMLTLVVLPSFAATTILVQSETWESFGGTTDDGKEPVCGMSSDVDSRYFGLKQFSSDRHFTIQVGTRHWKIARDEKINIRLHFDSNPVWNAVGTGMIFNDGDSGLQFAVSENESTRFMREFRNSKSLRIEYLRGNIADWRLNLAGTSKVGQSFDACRTTLPRK